VRVPFRYLITCIRAAQHFAVGAALNSARKQAARD
jgi:hypothetical protein